MARHLEAAAVEAQQHLMHQVQVLRVVLQIIMTLWQVHHQPMLVRPFFN